MFLDIDMPGISGLEIAKKLREENSDIILIFVSAHEQYVFESIEYSPFRYIRKSRIEKELFLDLKAAYARLGEMQDSYKTFRYYVFRNSGKKSWGPPK